MTLQTVSPGTIEYESELRHKNEMARVQAEISGKSVSHTLGAFVLGEVQFLPLLCLDTIAVCF